MRLEGRTALITGGGSGIGGATARLFAREGARVFVVGRRADALERTVRSVLAEGGEAAARAADVTDDADVRAAVDEAATRWGGLDIVVNAAGLAPEWTPVHETTDEVWDRVLDVNLKGVFRVCRAALPRLVERGAGAIVNVSSISAFKASNTVASYGAAKAALLALTRCIAAEYGWQGVRANCVVPSWVETPMTGGFLEDPSTRDDVARRHALPRVASPDEVARTILYLAADDASFVTGAAYPVDGGLLAL